MFSRVSTRLPSAYHCTTYDDGEAPPPGAVHDTRAVVPLHVTVTDNGGKGREGAEDVTVPVEALVPPRPSDDTAKVYETPLIRPVMVVLVPLTSVTVVTLCPLDVSTTTV
jgi:hypothetical protein